MNFRISAAVAALFAMSLLSQSAHAHFLWLVRADASDSSQIHVYFAEAAEADDPDLLDRLQGLAVWQLDGPAAPKEVSVAKGEESLTAGIEAAPSSLFVLSHDYGVISRGEETFLLCYYAKTGPVLGDPAWTKIDCQKLARLDLIPEGQGDKLVVKVLWQGKPAAGAEVKLSGAGAAFTETSDASGIVRFPRGKGGLFSIRARHIEERSGKQGDQEFASARHYATLALTVPAADAANAADAKSSDGAAAASGASAKSAAKSSYPKLPEMVTSFGGAVAGDDLYVYGGHTGDAHSYSHAEQGHELRRLNLREPKAWETIAEGPHLQGLALVAHGDKLYRIGGFTARNKEGEEQDLWSQDDVARFDPADKQWHELPPLPEPRSSHDAAVVGDTLYVVGGWQLQGEKDSVWHDTAWSLDLTAASPQWKPLPKPPFERRALALAAHEGKLYVIGGMQHEGGPTTRVDVFDPKSAKWSQGPNLQGEPMEGFGCSAFATGGRLYASTIRGNLQRLSEDGQAWETERKLPTARFFHRMLPIAQGKFVIVGGANMGIGKFAELEVIEVE